MRTEERPHLLLTSGTNKENYQDALRTPGIWPL